MIEKVLFSSENRVLLFLCSLKTGDSSGFRLGFFELVRKAMIGLESFFCGILFLCEKQNGKIIKKKNE